MPFPSRVGRYEIKSRIGGGGMGTLYLARDTNPTTDRLVALKLLNANLEHADLRGRFEREARSLAALSHPNIVVIHDSGEYAGAPFIVMEYVRGESLAEKIRRRSPLSLGQKVRLMAELCDGLAHAHAAGIIHRDIKPANLMVDQHGRLKILDFGIARADDGRHTQLAAPLTRLHMAIGTPGYMSPEQIEGLEVDHRTDLFSAGTVCYELLTYREAFAGATTRQIEKRVMHDDPPPIDTLVPGVDPRIVEIVALAMKKDPAERAQSARELYDAFTLVRAGLPSDEQPTHVTPLPPVEATSGRDSRRRRAAEVAYNRAIAARADGARDFARRSALEALAENADHQAARTLLAELGGEADVAPEPRVIEPTELATADPAGEAATLITPAGAASRRPLQPMPWRPEHRPWVRFVPLAGAIAVAGVALGVGLAFQNRWLPGGEGDRVPAPSRRLDTERPRDPGGTAPAESEPVIPTKLLTSLRDAGGVSITDAEVILNPGNLVAPGDGFGMYVFDTVAPGPYTLTVRHPFFRERAVPVEVTQGGTRQEIVLDRLMREPPGPIGARGRRSPPSDEPERTKPPAGIRRASPGTPTGDAEEQKTVPSGPPSGVPTGPSSGTPAEQPSTPPAGPASSPRSSVLAQDALERAVRALEVDGDVDRAEQLAAEARRFDPDSTDVARFLESLREIRGAELRQRVRDHVLRAQRLFRDVGDLDGAEREVDAALKLMPGDPQALDLREEITRVKAVGAKKKPKGSTRERQESQ
jgi:hypothetical protein